ncbi:DUF5686 and carboxypeptidase regulatory-like domain-containing protein [Solitalea sp. MAHUQ-68]|uniref:DUF5686 and carboxypeptidase regulatory-like domain-containing protein n=1 Tax=Solitalea agri TaxID=2953739 RepID=A0A9X2JD50_9SPHI|nr:DUF5686 and carboxypeptidase regulatory-like domain-containing protein [Solitalea agri]MCO4293229.1 DUF5686 and carboxypeptidase regulatory-like domain-containing protein [Solitalea agri]
MRFYIFICLIFIVSTVSAVAGTISGKITTSNGAPIPFANVYLENTTIGTTANAEGFYSLKVNPGVYKLIFKTVGYKQLIKSISITNDPLELNVVLEQEVYTLNEINVSAKQEDPAYEVIRNAIKKRKHHLNEVKGYSCDVYIKGLQRLRGAPKKFLGVDVEQIGKEIGLDSNRRGIIYLSESESKFNFQRPDNVREEMISSKVSGRSNGFSFNQSSDLMINLYENLVQFNQLSPRGIVSPIADNALFYYRYRLAGTANVGDLLINKIELIPRRKNDPVFRGFVYIIEDSWRLYSADVLLTQDAQIRILDSLTVSQQYYPADSKVWMLASQKFSFNGNVLGFKFAGDYIGVYKNYDIDPKFPKNFFNGEVLNVTKESNKKDSSYWAQARPVPLTSEEKIDYIRKDSIETLRKSPVYLDSIDRKSNKFKPLSFVLGGYTYQQRYKKQNWQISPVLFDNLQFNTVEGVNLTLRGSFRKNYESRQTYSIIPEVRYGFSNQHLNGNVQVYYRFDPMKSGSISLKIGTEVVDFNNQGSMTPLFNTYNTLVYASNYLKLYERQFVTATFSRELANGIQFNATVDYANRLPLVNANFYSFKPEAEREFTANNPYYGLNNDPAFVKNQALSLNVGTIISFGSEYITRPDGKFYVGSKWPKLALNYKAGLPVMGSDVDYHSVNGRLYDSGIRLGLLGNIAYSIGAGKFLSNRSTWFMDYKQFKGNRVTFYEGSSSNVFRFLDYYQFSTNDYYLEGHVEHNFSGFFMNKIPLLRKLRLEEIVGANYLQTEQLNNYSELYFGLQRLMLRAEFGLSWMGGNTYQSAFRLSTSF